MDLDGIRTHNLSKCFVWFISKINLSNWFHLTIGQTRDSFLKKRLFPSWNRQSFNVYIIMQVFWQKNMFSVSSFDFYLLFGFQWINFTFSGRINQLFERKTTHNRCKSKKIVKDELPEAINACVYFSALHFWSNYVGWLKPM